ncbi:DUF1102 domain-containing protein [Natronosalvus vescus]|uniref:DUF1102 domain-containing protein n=1 Tax=Natronosalvus vescus TaxID=2953881 RepID=UPI002091CAC6|nr:DUF1102 domain-containing protein [Natronosalvus vescus]
MVEIHAFRCGDWLVVWMGCRGLNALETLMERRKFLIGAGSTAIGASAIIGSGAFSRIESQRHVSIAVAEDSEAYLGLEPLDTLNSQNYVALDDNGHLYVQIDGEGDQQDNGGDGPEGVGVNSDSSTWFDGMFDICNNGKAEATVRIDVAGLQFHSSSEDGIEPDDDYGRPIVDVFYYDDEGNEVSILTDSEDESWDYGEDLTLDVGECETMNIRTNTKGIDATMDDEPLVEGDATVVADAPGAGEVND